MYVGESMRKPNRRQRWINGLEIDVDRGSTYPTQYLAARKTEAPTNVEAKVRSYHVQEEKERKKQLASIFHTFYVQLMYDAWVWVLFMLLSLVGHREEWIKNSQMWDNY